MSALNSRNTAARALFRSVRCFFKKSSAQDSAQAEPIFIRKVGQYPDLAGRSVSMRQTPSLLSRPVGTPSLRDEKKQQLTHRQIGPPLTSTTLSPCYY
jgi:hypothetical protein